MATRISIYDSTLRDGTQGEKINFSVEDKLRIARRLDELGLDYIEGGWPGSNPKDEEFFRRARTLRLKHARVTAFGSTRHKKNRPAADPNLVKLVAARTPVITIFGKTWDLHVREALRCTPEQNLQMIEDSVAFLKATGREVIYDAEHFFDGYAADAAYAVATLEAARRGGADLLCLCETNGGQVPHQVAEAVRAVRAALGPAVPLGIHAHNDTECGVANSLAAVGEGCVHVQGTINGYGERCGNANLCSIIPNLQLKLGYKVLTPAALARLTDTSRLVSELANLSPNTRLPYVGNSAFAHKGGIHVSAVQRRPGTYEHIDPALVGNRRRVLVSELSGKSNLLFKAEEWGLDVEADDEAVKRALAQLKDLEAAGYQFEGAEASFEVLMSKALGRFKPYFAMTGLKVLSEKRGESESFCEATIKVLVGGQEEHTVAEGDGPVNALDNALRKGLRKFYRHIDEMFLTDYKVRVLNETEGTAAKVRVLIEFSNGKSTWGTVGCSTNIVEASWEAMVDGINYFLKHRKKL